MKKNYAFLLSKLYSSNCSFIINDVASLCKGKEKKTKHTLLVVFMLFLAMSSGQKAIAQNTPNHKFTIQTIFTDHNLISAIAEGRSGGGGHGNPDWVLKPPIVSHQITINCQKV